MNGDQKTKSPVPFAVPEHLVEVASTNSYLVDLVRSGLDDGVLVPPGYAVVADRQTKGRGRLERTWQAPANSAVLCSILFTPELEADQLHLTAWAVALAAVEACSEVAEVTASLKWPNDLVCSERKLAGILSEIVPDAVAGPSSRPRPSVVVGIGINVNWPPDWPPRATDDPELAAIATRATALNRLAGHEVDRGQLTSRLLVHAGSWNEALSSEKGRRALASKYRRCCVSIGRQVRVELTDETVTGLALDVDDSGCLLVSTEVCIQTVSAGDVIHLR